MFLAVKVACTCPSVALSIFQDTFHSKMSLHLVQTPSIGIAAIFSAAGENLFGTKANEFLYF
jgi:hypothetical protein